MTISIFRWKTQAALRISYYRLNNCRIELWSHPVQIPCGICAGFHLIRLRGALLRLSHLPLKGKAYAVRVSGIAHGIPIGGNIEYAVEVTLAKSIENRRYILCPAFTIKKNRLPALRPLPSVKQEPPFPEMPSFPIKSIIQFAECFFQSSAVFQNSAKNLRAI